jgi:hypothetical protein
MSAVNIVARVELSDVKSKQVFVASEFDESGADFCESEAAAAGDTHRREIVRRDHVEIKMQHVFASICV